MISLDMGLDHLGEDVWSHRLNPENIQEIRALINKGKLSARKIGSIYGVSHTTILSIKNRKIWKQVEGEKL